MVAVRNRASRTSRKKGRSYRCEFLLFGVNVLLFSYGIISTRYVRMVQEEAAVSAPTGMEQQKQQQQPEVSTATGMEQPEQQQQRVVATRSGPPPQCTQEQLDVAAKQLPPIDKCFKAPWRNECSITLATKCPDSKNWLEDHYRKLKEPDKTFIGINVGCNKGYDAVSMLRLGTGQHEADKVAWKKALGSNVEEGVCQQESLPNLDVSDYPFQRSGHVYCVEPMPLTAHALKEASKSTGLDKLGLTVTQAAIANGHGKVYFPSVPIKGKLRWQNVKVGTENKGISSCNQPGEGEPAPDGCDAVQLMSLDTYVQQYVPPDASRIHILTTDVEGYDFEVMLGGKETLKKTEYVEFEYNWKGPWNKQSLELAIKHFDSLQFTCYWAGIQKLWRITNCWVDHYSSHNWSNVACVNRQLVPKLASRMEEVFLETLQSYKAS